MTTSDSPMRLDYDKDSNMGYVFLTDKVHRVNTAQVDERVILDYDVESGELVGIEIFGSEQ